MRVAFITNEYPPDSSNGGIATYVQQASRLLAKRGHDVEFFASTPFLERSVEGEGFQVHWIQAVDVNQFSIKAGHRFAIRHRERPFDVLEGPEFNAEARIAKTLVPSIALVV